MAKSTRRASVPVAQNPADDWWTRPPEKPLPPLAQDQPSRGSMTVLVLVDSSAPAHAMVGPGVIAALHHWGAPYTLHDLASGPLGKDQLRGHAGILLAQENLGRALRPADAQAMLAAMEEGVGLLSLDPWVDNYPKALTAKLQLSAGRSTSAPALRLGAVDHFITAWRRADEKVTLRQSVAINPLSAPGPSLLQSEKGASLLRAGRCGSGRWVWWGVSPKLWLRETLGHSWGLDDLLWRGLAWSARKPWVMKAMPPLLTMRFDDCQGAGSLWWLLGYAGQKPLHPALRRILNLQHGGQASVVHGFKYVRELNLLGWKPEVSLFIDQVTPDQWLALESIYQAGNVQLSAHALEDGYDAQGKWWSHFVYMKGLEVRRGGKVAFRHSIGDVAGGDEGDFQYRVVRYDPEELARNFIHLDRLWAAHRIRPGLTPNMHWRNPTSDSLPLLKERGQVFAMWPTRINYAYADPQAYDWRLLPYGDPGFCMDYLPIPVDAPTIAPTDFFNIGAFLFHGYKPDPLQPKVDYCRDGLPVQPGLLTHRNLSQIARSIVKQASLGLQGLFFGLPVSHEMNLGTLTVEEWRQVLQEVEQGLARYPRQQVKVDEISQTARDKCTTHLSRAEARDGRVMLEITGQAGAGAPLHLYRDEGDSCTCQWLSTGSFSGSRSLTL